MKSCLTDKVKNKELIVVDSLEINSLKTKDIKAIMAKLELAGKVLFVTAEENENLYMATRNLGYAYAIMADEINCLDIVNADILVCDEEANKTIEGGLK